MKPAHPLIAACILLAILALFVAQAACRFLSPGAEATPPAPIAGRGTPPPAPAAPIDAHNGASLALLARLGTGPLIDAAWGPDRRTSAVLTGSGIYFYDTENQTPTRFIPPGENAYRLAFAPGGARLALAVGTNSPQAAGSAVRMLDANTWSEQQRMQVDAPEGYGARV
ncbi:MAG: hypothetical protein EHM70_09310, partial [Chloroflexota bacterium]